MEGKYPIYLGNRAIGRVQVTAEGLYLRFRCQCDDLQTGVSRVVLRWGDREEVLGVLAPEGAGFALDRRVAAKSMPEEVPEFLVRREGSVEGMFVPLCPEEPFAYLHRLKEGFLVQRDGQTGVVLPTTPVVNRKSSEVRLPG